MSLFSNGAYSAPKGYDLRAPFNVPMGNIQCLRVVEPFSWASMQKDTVTEPFVSRGRRPPYIPGLPPMIEECNPVQRYSLEVTHNCCTNCYGIVPGPCGHPTPAERALAKLYIKGPLIK